MTTFDKNIATNDFEHLASRIIGVQDALQAQAAHAINLALTSRNWLIGYYIVEYEQEGADRAQYGEQLLKKLAKKINRKGMEPRRLREFRQFYLVYNYIGPMVQGYLSKNVSADGTDPAGKKVQSLTALFQSAENEGLTKVRSVTAKLESGRQDYGETTVRYALRDFRRICLLANTGCNSLQKRR